MTLRYQIQEKDDEYHVTEADGPSVPATGEYDSLTAAIEAVQRIADESGITDLEWEEFEWDGIRYWVAEWDKDDESIRQDA